MYTGEWIPRPIPGSTNRRWRISSAGTVAHTRERGP